MFKWHGPTVMLYIHFTCNARIQSWIDPCSQEAPFEKLVFHNPFGWCINDVPLICLGSINHPNNLLFVDLTNINKMTEKKYTAVCQLWHDHVLSFVSVSDSSISFYHSLKKNLDRAQAQLTPSGTVSGNHCSSFPFFLIRVVHSCIHFYPYTFS